jgi:hypothetical protein
MPIRSQFAPFASQQLSNSVLQQQILRCAQDDIQVSYVILRSAATKDLLLRALRRVGSSLADGEQRAQHTSGDHSSGLEA